jgi:hypothetical protein
MGCIGGADNGQCQSDGRIPYLMSPKPVMQVQSTENSVSEYRQLSHQLFALDMEIAVELIPVIAIVVILVFNASIPLAVEYPIQIHRMCVLATETVLTWIFVDAIQNGVEITVNSQYAMA